ncbi:MAG: menaquinone biosynthesis protein [Candidatus Solibacter usitatus]|nr:menaquinone biosynthesis protein [Candidatus Solibacter usitatus]
MPVVSAVSYLNTTPLIWGFEKTDLGRQIRLEYDLPAVCADRVRDGLSDIGILPVIEIERQGLEWLPGTGIACRGAVRSILLISKKPLGQVQSLALDSGSRTSVMLARILLAERYGSAPSCHNMPADLPTMLAAADAALVIGDPALRLDPESLRRQYEVLDLGEEWARYTGLPMIFALWAGKSDHLRAGMQELFAASCRYGLEHIDDIVASEAPARGIPLELARKYLSRHIVSELVERDYQGMREYLRLARELDTLKVAVSQGNSV